MGTLDRAALDAASDLARETVAVPEWGGDVVVQEMDGDDLVAFQDEAEAARAAGAKEGAYRTAARFLVRCLRDGAGARLFGDHEVDALARRNRKVLDRLFKVALRVNHFGEREVAAAAGKSDGAPSDGSSGS